MKSKSTAQSTIASFLLLCTILFSLSVKADSEPEGTWRLVSRTLPNGTKQMPPDVMGIGSYTKGQRDRKSVVWERVCLAV